MNYESRNIMLKMLIWICSILPCLVICDAFISQINLGLTIDCCNLNCSIVNQSSCKLCSTLTRISFNYSRMFLHYLFTDQKDDHFECWQPWFLKAMKTGIYDQLKNLQTHQKWCDKNGEPNNAVIIMKTCAFARTSASSYPRWCCCYDMSCGQAARGKIVKCIPFFSFFSWVGNDSGQELCQTDISNVSPQEGKKRV